MSDHEKTPTAGFLFDEELQPTPPDGKEKQTVRRLTDVLPTEGEKRQTGMSVLPAGLVETPVPSRSFGTSPPAEVQHTDGTPALPGASFSIGFIGQMRIKSILQRILDHQRLANAYLFTGPSGSGRLAGAVELARALNCRADGGQIGAACSCQSCRSIAKLQHPNLHLLVPLPRAQTQEENERAQKIYEETLALLTADLYTPLYNVQSPSWHILVGHIQDVQKELALTQDRPGARVVIINPADRMNEEAANAFLKHLEEPVSGCCIILITESPRDLLPTIVSRCQNIRFPALSPEEMAEILVARRGITYEEALAAAQLADGSFTRALSGIDGSSKARLESALGFLRATAQGNSPKLLQYAGEWSDNEVRIEIGDQLRCVSVWLQDALIQIIETGRPGDQETGYPAASRNLGRGADPTVVKRLAERYTPDTLTQALGVIEEARLAIDSNVSPHLAITALGLRLNRIFR